MLIILQNVKRQEKKSIINTKIEKTAEGSLTVDT